MGTRSTYRVLEQYTDEKTQKVKDQELCLMYLQYDGYPTGHPLETAEWLSKGRVVNGFSPNETILIFNGAGCLAAQLVEKYKNGPGGCYLHPLKHRGKCWEDYLYDIIIKEDNSIEFVCYENDKRPKELFRGSPENFVKKYQKEDVEA